MDLNCIDEFQNKVSKLLIRNRNVCDILTKLQSACTKTSRSSFKAATGCGCIKIKAEKLPVEFNSPDYNSIHSHSGIEGELCMDCASIIEENIGENLFYTACLCNALGLSMYDIMKQELKRVNSLGKYNLM